jgi:hypothetical protein
VSGAEGRLWFSVDGEVQISAAQFRSLNWKGLAVENPH